MPPATLHENVMHKGKALKKPLASNFYRWHILFILVWPSHSSFCFLKKEARYMMMCWQRSITMSWHTILPGHRILLPLLAYNYPNMAYYWHSIAYFCLAWHTPLVHLYFMSMFISRAMCDCRVKIVRPKASSPQYDKNDSFSGIVGRVEVK